MKVNLFLRAGLLSGILLGLFLIGGCGSKSNSVTSADPATGGEVHPGNWLPAAHAISAGTDLTPCTTCHGSDLLGGITGVSCLACHIGTVTTEHPVDYSNYAWAPAGHSKYVGVNGNSSCANIYCHAADLSGVASSGPSCTSCHLGGAGAVHPANVNSAPWAPLGHSEYVLTNGTNTCSNILCHAANLSGVSGSGPSCTSCHIGTATTVHPAGWDTNALLHGQYVASNGTSSCRNTLCHGANLTGVSTSGYSCFSCHNFSLP